MTLSLTRQPAWFHRASSVAVALLLGGCASDNPPARQPVETTAAAAEETSPPAAPATEPATRIGTIPLMRPLPAQGACRATGSPAEPRYAYDSDEFPARTIIVGEGSAARAFIPSFLEIRSRQTASGGIDERETIYVLFSPEGRIETGTRQYINTATPPARETGGLLPGDSAAVRDLAIAMLQKCKQAAATP